MSGFAAAGVLRFVLELLLVALVPPPLALEPERSAACTAPSPHLRSTMIDWGPDIDMSDDEDEAIEQRYVEAKAVHKAAKKASEEKPDSYKRKKAFVDAAQEYKAAEKAAEKAGVLGPGAEAKRKAKKKKAEAARLRKEKEEAEAAEEAARLQEAEEKWRKWTADQEASIESRATFGIRVSALEDRLRNLAQEQEVQLREFNARQDKHITSQTVEGINLAKLWQQQRQSTQRGDAAQKEGCPPAGDRKKVSYYVGESKKRQAQTATKPQPVPPNHKVLKLMKSC